MHRILTALLVLLFSPALLAQEAAPFLIERIEVRNATRISPDIVIAEARLRTGETYGEHELREANDRLKRLPFLLDAQFALEKGSARGSFVLVITVMETRPFFYLFDSTFFYRHQSHLYSSESDNEAVVGYRHFVGRRGMLHAGLFSRREERPYTSNLTSLELGYTRFDIFGTRAFATASLGTTFAYEGDGDRVLPRVVAGIPLSGNQTVTVEYEQTDHGRDVRTAERVLSARWTYDTTNHPFFPTRGATFSVGPVASWLDVSDPGSQFSGPVVGDPGYAQHRSTVGIEGELARFWELSPLWSIAFRMDGGFATIDDRGSGQFYVPRDGSIAYGDASVRFTRMLVQSADVEKRLELTLEGLTENRRDNLGGVYYSYPRDHVTGRAAVNWVRRDSWGTLRLGAGYAW